MMAVKKMTRAKKVSTGKTPVTKSGRVWKFGDNIDTDAIIPGRFLILNDAGELAQHAFEGTRDEFAKEVKEGDIVVGEKNFGCGSSREHAPLALVGCGVHVVMAQSFARIFFRNAINLGLLLIESDLTCEEGSTVAFDISEGWVETGGNRHTIRPLSPRMQEILKAGGLVEYWRAHR